MHFPRLFFYGVLLKVRQTNLSVGRRLKKMEWVTNNGEVGLLPKLLNCEAMVQYDKEIAEV